MALVLRIYDLAVERAAIELRGQSLISLETVLKRLQHLEISDCLVSQCRVLSR